MRTIHRRRTHTPSFTGRKSTTGNAAACHVVAGLQSDGLKARYPAAMPAIAACVSAPLYSRKSCTAPLKKGSEG